MLDNKTFSTKLRGIVSSALNQRDNIQAVIVSGFEEYNEHGNSGQLSRVLKACVGVKSLPTKVILDYIKAHANVSYIKVKDGTMQFKKSSGETACTVIPFETTWYDWSGNGQHNPPADFDIHARIKALMTSTKKAMDDGKIKSGQEAKARDAMQALQALLVVEEPNH